jgi:inosine-uridine nucleoside N-ribohydrolase
MFCKIRINPRAVCDALVSIDFLKQALSAIALCLLFTGAHASVAQPQPAKQKVIIDTDAGDDIDDAFALALALRSPELQILQINSAYGDTHLRAKLLDRFLRDSGESHIPLAQGITTHSRGTFTQRPYAEQLAEPSVPYPDAVATTLDRIRQSPGEITLIAVGPFSNIGAMIDRDPATFRKLKRVVLMGGSILRGYSDLGYEPDKGPDPEWNIRCDIASARKLLASGVPIFMMPLDATELKLDEVKRQILLKHGSRLTDQLAILYPQWGGQTPTLFDAMAVAYAVDPSLCPATPMHLSIDDRGMTLRSQGEPNVQACLNSSSDNFFRFYLRRLLAR